MVRRVADCGCQIGKTWRFFGLFQQFDGLCYGLAVAANLFRLAPQTWPVTGDERFLAGGEKLDIFALGPPRGTARLAVNAGRPDRPDDPPVPAAITTHEGGPGGIGIEARDVAHGP
jgi:hypothetical protein